MQQRLGFTVMLAFALAIVPALAGEGLRTLPAGQQAQLIALDEAPLAAIEGGQVCVGCLNLALNVAVLSAGGTQTTGAQTIGAPRHESAAPGTCRGIAVNFSVLSPGVTQRTGAQARNVCRTRLVAVGGRLAVNAR